MSQKNQALIELQKNLYRYMKTKALGLETDQSNDLKAYQKAQFKLSQRSFEIVSPKSLTSRLQQSQLIFVGDFHSFDQSSRNMHRILRELEKKGPSLTLGVEFVSHEHQDQVDSFCQGHITELEFLEAIDYKNSWRFPWHHYKKFFQLAKEKQLKVLALNSEGSLQKRDLFASQVIANYFQEKPETSLAVFFGELHIIPDKLPQKVKNILPQTKMTIIHQNLDEVFWKISRIKESQNNKGELKSDTDIIVKFNDEEYALQTSPPWTKYESMIYWYENLVEDPDFEIHEYILETGLSFNSTVPDTFVFLTKKLIDILKFNITYEEIENFNLYDHQKMNIIEKRLTTLEPTFKNFCKKLLMRGRSFRLPFKNDFYCSSYSVNRMAFLCGLHLQSLLLNNKRDNFDSLYYKGQFERFGYLIKQMAMAYFCTKLLNPYRKCDHYEDIKIKIKTLKNKPIARNVKDESDINVLTITKEILEARSKPNFKNSIKIKLKNLDGISLYYVARLCGYSLGDLLYSNHYVKEVESFKLIFDILIKYSEQLELEEDIENLFLSIIPKTGPSGLRKRLF